MVDPHIVKALVEVALFLELSDDKTIDPDGAVAAMSRWPQISKPWMQHPNAN